jgi:alkanesulfonate monooxygenase SsuD/methylene tetrahydromethanopterin reductase-like flavin-dependent oxidoreductase (luciferase family)
MPRPGRLPRTAIDIAPLGELADPRAIVRLAVAAEASGWDGISVWDSLGVSMGTAAVDPFVALAAVGTATRRSRLIASVIALPRRRPQLVAQAIGTLDRLSDGRCVLGVGAGGDPGDFEPFGEPFGAAARIERFDEALGLVDRWLRGESVEHDGAAFVARAASVGPSPVQRPRPPVWIGGMRPAALRKAARWDGWIAVGMSDDGSSMALTPESFAGMVERVLAERRRVAAGGGPFDIAILGRSEPDDRGAVGRFAAAGATWWFESLSPMRGSIDELLAIVESGPPSD